MKQATDGVGKFKVKKIAPICGGGANVSGIEVQKANNNPHPFIAQNQGFRR
ncbi:MAG: hypothetical protein HND56_09660 [Pseudomonadota bacterium]|nr:MAG: hypothetical protein HND56_09660 [Pseudomonadota bacterium]|tara:strand:- start:1047 stop:1199 length:153 start_codon:yes stop_codon:yes gene_type:complete